MALWMKYYLHLDAVFFNRFDKGGGYFVKIASKRLDSRNALFA